LTACGTECASVSAPRRAPDAVGSQQTRRIAEVMEQNADEEEPSNVRMMREEIAGIAVFVCGGFVSLQRVRRGTVKLH